jgi:hypothetical protein
MSMGVRSLPLAVGPERPPGGPSAGPFAVGVTPSGDGFLHIRGSGMAFTAALTAQQLRMLASMATSAAAAMERGPGRGAEVVSIFGGSA